jgi:hypothetical protein
VAKNTNKVTKLKEEDHQEMDNQARGKKAVELKEEDYQEGDNQVGVRGEENNRAQGGQPLRKDDQGGEEGGKAQGDDHQKGDDQD